jgi:hypothetical protein
MTLDPQQLRSRLLDHRGLDLDTARRVTYVIERFPLRLRRAGAVAAAAAGHRRPSATARTAGPPARVTGAQARRLVRRDSAATWSPLAEGRARGPGGVPADRHRRADPPRRARRAAARGHPQPALLSLTRLTAADDRFAAGAVSPTSAGPADQAERVCDLVHASLDYADGVTSVRTTAAEALVTGAASARHGHVMLALCHLVGLLPVCVRAPDARAARTPGSGRGAPGADADPRCRSTPWPPRGQRLRHDMVTGTTATWRDLGSYIGTKPVRPPSAGWGAGRPGGATA